MTDIVERLRSYSDPQIQWGAYTVMCASMDLKLSADEIEALRARVKELEQQFSKEAASDPQVDDSWSGRLARANARAEQAERERDALKLTFNHTFDRAKAIAAERDSAKRDAARLRELLREIRSLVMFTTGQPVIGGSLGKRIDAELEATK